MALSVGRAIRSARADPNTMTDVAMPISPNGHRKTGCTQRATKRHHADECRGHQPQRAPTEQHRIKSDRDHDQHVVEPAEWMREAVHEATGIAMAGMREGH